MKVFTRFTVVFILMLAALGVQAQIWQTITTDAAGDGASNTTLDATLFEHAYDSIVDSVYFRLTMNEMPENQQQNFGVHVMIRMAGKPEFTFWGNENNLKWTKLITVRVSGTPPSNYAGTIGISDIIGINNSDFQNLSSNKINIAVDTTAKTITLSMKRVELVTDVEMWAGSSMNMRVAAAVGSSSSWNDDIFDTTKTITLRKVLVSVAEQTKNAVTVYPNPAATNLIIELSEGSEEIAAISLINPIGQQVTIPVIREGNIARLNVAGLPEGVYTISAGEMGSKRVVIAR
ncbi:MAG: T9SS type A sorting domain-containing protein [Bacteroidota bacterium]